MIYLNAFLFAGTVCLLAQIILDKTKLTPGHVTVIFVVLGAFLDVFDIYDKFIIWAGGGALVPITSFGHMLIHGTIGAFGEQGFMGLFVGTLDLTSAGITATIVISFILALIFNPKD